jgi:hypothetical protein
MKIIRSVAVIAFALALSACATKWAKPGAGEQELAQDQARCEQDTENEFADATGGLKGLGSYVDRRGYFERCMIIRGWRDRATQTADVQAPSPSSETDLPLRFPVYSR